ncbi:fimbrial protein [Citrobacter portucalensis]|uniref:fimbrial protein n=1 Tax=Citrobacter portucalensis TaxID=1639133 RepID=UPI00226BAC8A|nr:fimbrial protein [Citrobacter portucalensis]MCX8980968.1 fimbrial protein [Citrobacter portucalensis]
MKSCFNITCSLVILFITSPISIADELKSVTQRTVIDAIVVASSCRVMVDAGYSGTRLLNFGSWNKSADESPQAGSFTLWLYEDGATMPGCSAFRVAPLASITFGNAGQLDNEGVITRGAGGGIRIDIRALDQEADYRGKIANGNNIINYPSRFVEAGKLRFSALPVNLEKASAGEYRGSVAFVLSYP